MGLKGKGNHPADTVTRGAFSSPATSLGNLTGTWRSERPLYQTSASPCHTSCPAGEDIPVYLSHMALNEPRKAWEALVSANPMPAVTGRVCPHPCESSCHRGSYDAAVSIHSVERFLGDLALKEGWSYPLPERRAGGETPVAVVGAGPAGLSCAYHLRRLGYPVTLFEARSEAGGICRQAIPDYRLPPDIVAQETDRILGTGIDFRPGTTLGRDVSLEDLESGFPAVFLAPGRQMGREWNIRHAVPGDLHYGLDLLKEWKNVGALPRWSRVVIVGGGNTAIDLARSLKRTGTGEVHIVTDEDLPSSGKSGRGTMPAIPKEIGLALEEGVLIHPNRTIRRLLIREERVVGVELVHALKETLEGTARHRSFEGTETILEADQVIPAVGQVVSPEGLATVLGEGSFISADPDGRVAGSGRLFAGGDACPGGGSVSHAVGSGHLAARRIDAQLRKQDPPPPRESAFLPFSRLNLHYFEPSGALSVQRLPVDSRTGFEEIERTGSTGEIAREADRCFSCGHCLECDNCWTLCPDNAVLKTVPGGPEKGPYVFDLAYCKGCGLCVKECPSGHILMVPEP